MQDENPHWLDKPLEQLPFVILDLETTGFAPPAARITEIALIRLSGEDGQFQTLVDPGIPIPLEITRVTGIDDGMVRGKPRIEEVLPRVAELMTDSIFVSHNVPFDWAFLEHAFRRNLNRPLAMPYLCTLKLSRRLLSLRSNALGAVATHFRLKPFEAHRAMADTLAVRGLLENFIPILRNRGISSGRDLAKNGLMSFSPPEPSRQFSPKRFP